MTYQFNQNITPTDGCSAVFQWKQFMKTVGWTVVSSSDGTTFDSSGDTITSGGNGAGGMLNQNAWFVIQQPATTRQFSFQSIGVHNPPAAPAATSWRVKYSPSGFVNGGAAQITPTANTSSFTGAEDAGVILGSALGTDAHPGGQTMFALDGTYRMQMLADDAAPNSFAWLCTIIPTSNVSSGFMFDAMAAGTFPGGDTDPYVVYHATSSFAKLPSITGISSAPTGFLKRGMAGESYLAIGATAFYLDQGGTPVIGGLPSNPTNNTDDLLPAVYARPQAWNIVGEPAGYKGVSVLMKWCTSARTTLDMLSVVSPGDRIVFGNGTFPWNNTNPVL